MGWLSNIVDDVKDAATDAGVELAGSAVSFAFKRQSKPWVFSNGGPRTEWMTKLDDNTLLTDIFIPGTHDTCSDSGGDLAETQHMNLKDQLVRGIRFFDIRAKHDHSDLPIHHGIVFMQMNFDDVVHACEDYLKEHPYEVILMRIGKEGEEGKHKQSFDEEVRGRFKTPDMWVSPSSFGKLSEVRGKILLLKIDSALMLPTKQAKHLDVQNLWDCGNYHDKKAAVDKHGKEHREAGKLYLSFASSVGLDGMAYHTPAMMASEVNKHVHDHIGRYGPGIYAMDFPGKKLIARILARNPKAGVQGKLQQAFRRYDKDGNGTLTRNEMITLLKKLGDIGGQGDKGNNKGSLTDEQVEELLNECDENNDGHISYEEFVDWVMPEKEPSLHSRF